MKSILFVCSGNTCRSPMAEAMMDEMVDDHPRLRGEVKVSSAGTFALDGSSSNENSQRVMEEKGIDIHKHKSRQLTREMAEDADIILTMEARHLEELEAISPESYGKAHTLKGYAEDVEGFPGEGYDIEDPFREPYENYLEAANQIQEALKKLIDKLDGLWGEEL